MADTTPNEPNDPLQQNREPGYADKRGKILPQPRAAWDKPDGMNRKFDPTVGGRVLDQALRN